MSPHILSSLPNHPLLTTIKMAGVFVFLFRSKPILNQHFTRRVQLRSKTGLPHSPGLEWAQLYRGAVATLLSRRCSRQRTSYSGFCQRLRAFLSKTSSMFFHSGKKIPILIVFFSVWRKNLGSTHIVPPH